MVFLTDLHFPVKFLVSLFGINKRSRIFASEKNRNNGCYS